MEQFGINLVGSPKLHADRSRRPLRLTVSCLLVFCALSSASAGELGANKSDLSSQYLPHPQATANVAGDHYIRRLMAKKAIADARDAGFAFLRVAVTGYFPANFGDRINDLALWISQPDAFWADMDEMFNDLDQASLRLVPSFDWNPTQFPALENDTLTTFLRDPDCPSRQLFAKFITEFIQRYRNRHTILFYELTNEMNLLADINLQSNCPKNGDAACVWTNFTTGDMMKFAEELVRNIKSVDPNRPVTSGYSFPRAAAAHLMERPAFLHGGGDWTADTVADFTHYLIAVHKPFDLISVHIYPGATAIRFGHPSGQEWKLVADAAGAAASAHKQLFVGEFGDTKGVTPFMLGVLQELVHDHVAYSAIWTWEFYQTAVYRTRDTPASRYSIEPGYSDRLIGLLMGTQRALEGKLAVPPLNDGAAQKLRVILTWPLPCSVIDKPQQLAAVASDGPQKVDRVDFIMNNKLLATAPTPPYYAELDPAGIRDEVVEITARAVATSGAFAEFNSPMKLNRRRNSCTVPSN